VEDLVKILMMTNTYRPVVGGLERSVEIFTFEYEKRGHSALVITPEFKRVPEQEPNVIRLRALRNVNKAGYSLPMPLSRKIGDRIKLFAPEVIHTHHPFLLGGTGLRLAGEMLLPLVFTYHTMLENYTYELPGDSVAMKQFVVEYAVRYANLCDQVIAPSESVASILRERGVIAPIETVPTGIYVAQFRSGDGRAARARLGIPESVFLVGYCGRVTPEKNLRFLARSVMRFMKREPRAHFLVVGAGELLEEIRELFRASDLCSRLHTPGVQTGSFLSDSYRAMDVLAFASLSETQGLVLAEAMAAGTPVVALDAPGVREIVEDRENGRLVQRGDPGVFADALQWVSGLSGKGRSALIDGALKTSEEFSVSTSVGKILDIYRRVIEAGRTHQAEAVQKHWSEARRNLDSEWKLFQAFSAAATEAISKTVAERTYFQSRETRK
jgi:1,2-diacylglycerol 3-alpha-glucosyltransferase